MLELKDVSAGYGKRLVLDGVTASFERGRLTGIIGVNGCGKSTLLKAILGTVQIRGGAVTVDGEDLLSMKKNERAKRIAYLAQGQSAPDMTVMQLALHGRFPYLGYPRRYSDADREAAFSALERMGISELAERPLQTLSGGMRQKAYIAMALAQNTDYILLDEPTVYLDIASRLELMRILRELADKGKGIIAVMHELTLAFEESDRIAVMRDGGIAAMATPEEISKSQTVGDVFGVFVRRSETEERYFYSDKDHVRR